MATKIIEEGKRGCSCRYINIIVVGVMRFYLPEMPTMIERRCGDIEQYVTVTKYTILKKFTLSLFVIMALKSANHVHNPAKNILKLWKNSEISFNEVGGMVSFPSCALS